jgi:hypothetical protein
MRPSRLIGQVVLHLLIIIAIITDGLLVVQVVVAAELEAPIAKRVVVPNIPNDLLPLSSNVWKCSCDSDGCWPGCFTVAGASVLKYWAARGYAALWNGDANATYYKLREMFPNLLCYGNGNNNGRPGDTGYDAFDVATGIRTFAAQKGYAFKTVPIAEPTFDDITREIDSGRPVIGAFAESPWGSHAGTIIGYDTTNGQRAMIVRPNLPDRDDIVLKWGVGYQGFSMVTVEPASPAEINLSVPINYDVTVNDKDPGFSMTGDWQVALGFGYGGESRAIWSANQNPNAVDDTAWARWQPEIPFDGMWEVLVWMPHDERDTNLSQSTLYKINHAEGQNLVRRSQQDATQGWMSLGAYPYTRGTGSSASKFGVTLGNFTNDKLPVKLWADAVKFAWRAPLIVRAEEDARVNYLIQNGKRYRIPDMDTFTALRLKSSHIRTLPELPLKQYPFDNNLPSMFTSWVGQYYNNMQLSMPTSVIRNDPQVNFRWNGIAPANNLSTTGFSARWSRVWALSEGAYPFKVQAIGGVRVWVDGRLVVDGWDAPENVLIEHQSIVSLNSGLHKVDVEYVNRKGLSQIQFFNLPPSVPQADPNTAIATRGVTATLKWLDTGDAVQLDQRKFYAGIWQAEGKWSLNSGWITGTEWTVAFPQDGKYVWRVSASDGSSVSDWSRQREIIVDRTPPFAQMISAIPRNIAEIDPATGKTKATTNLGAVGSLTGLTLTWSATDTLSGVAFYEIQAREIVRATEVMTAEVVSKPMPRTKLALVISGTQELTQTIAYTDTIQEVKLMPMKALMTVNGTWVTVGANITSTNMSFVGMPGSAYEFRVRAVDRAGNAQAWVDGYSVQAQIDPNTSIYRIFVPNVLNGN